MGHHDRASAGEDGVDDDPFDAQPTGLIHPPPPSASCGALPPVVPAPAPTPNTSGRVVAVFSRSAAVYSGPDRTPASHSPDRVLSAAPAGTSAAPTVDRAANVEVVRRATAAPRPAPQAGSSPPSPQSAQELLRSLHARRGAALPRPSAPQSAAAPLGAKTQASALELLAQEFSGGSAVARWASSGLLEAHRLEQGGDAAGALGLLQVVLSRHSDRRLLEQRDRLQLLSRQAASGGHRELAITAQGAKNFREAAEHWRTVADADRKDGKAALQAAVCYMQAKEIKLAGPLAKRAVELAPNDVLARRVLVRFYESMGMELNAVREKQALDKLLARG